MGFGWAAQLAVGPIFNPASTYYAQMYYHAARGIDRAEGRNFVEGASVLAGAKVAKNRGLVHGYRWAFGVSDVIDTICAKGPVVLGLNWYDGMYETESDGRIRLNGPLVGGHCILASGFIKDHPLWGGNWIRLTNSWGWGYGIKGNGFIREMDLQYLLQQQGEACIADEVKPVVPTKPWWQRLAEAVKS